MSVLDFALGWILNFHPALSILIVAFLVSLIITLALMVFTDQKLMKDLKEEQKELQKQMKSLRNNPAKLAKINSQFMETNMKYMSHSMRPTLFTFLPIILIFGWLNSHIGYYPIQPGMPFEVTIYFDQEIGEDIDLLDPSGNLTIIGSDLYNKRASWKIEGDVEGLYNLKIVHNGIEYTKDVLITKKRTYITPEKPLKKKSFLFSSYDINRAEKIIVNNEKVIPLSDVPVIKEIPWVSSWGWLGVYIFFSLIFSMGLRKLFKVY